MARMSFERETLDDDTRKLVDMVLPVDYREIFPFYDKIEADNDGALPFKLQRSITQCIEKCTYDEAVRGSDQRQIAHHFSTATSVSSLWLHARPGNPTERLTDNELVTNNRLRLGIACAQNTPSKCAACQNDFDKFGDHALTCKKTACWNYNHNRVRDVVARFLKSSATNSYVRIEQRVGRRRDHRNRRGELVPGSAIFADQVMVLNRKIVWCDNACNHLSDCAQPRPCCVPPPPRCAPTQS